MNLDAKSHVAGFLGAGYHVCMVPCMPGSMHAGFYACRVLVHRVPCMPGSKYMLLVKVISIAGHKISSSLFLTILLIKNIHLSVAGQTFELLILILEVLILTRCVAVRIRSAFKR